MMLLVPYAFVFYFFFLFCVRCRIEDKTRRSWLADKNKDHLKEVETKKKKRFKILQKGSFGLHHITFDIFFLFVYGVNQKSLKIG